MEGAVFIVKQHSLWIKNLSDVAKAEMFKDVMFQFYLCDIQFFLQKSITRLLEVIVTGQTRHYLE